MQTHSARARIRIVKGVGGLALSLLLASACGTTSKSIEKADFIAKGNAICKAGDAKLSAAADKISGDDDAELIAFFKSTAIPETRKEIDALEDLGYPDGDKDRLKSI